MLKKDKIMDHTIDKYTHIREIRQINIQINTEFE